MAGGTTCRNTKPPFFFVRSRAPVVLVVRVAPVVRALGVFLRQIEHRVIIAVMGFGPMLSIRRFKILFDMLAALWNRLQSAPQDLAAETLTFRECRFQRLFTSRSENNTRAAAREFPRGCPTDSTGGSGNDDDGSA